MGLSTIERYSATWEVMSDLKNWNNSSSYPIGSALASRTIAVIATPFLSAMDVVVHAFFGAIKTVSGVLVTPYNFVARLISSKYVFSEEWGLGSAVIHLVLIVKSVCFIPVVMLTAGFNPELAEKNADPASIFGPIMPAPVEIDSSSDLGF